MWLSGEPATNNRPSTILTFTQNLKPTQPTYMNKIIPLLSLSFLIIINACSVKLSSIKDKSNEEIKESYKVTKDVAYGADKEENLDIYISDYAKKFGNKNFTIVFLHGGGYYMSDKSNEERYIQPYLKKGFNVVNVNYRLKRGIPLATEDLTSVLNFLKANNVTYQLNLEKIILTGFSAGAHIASIVGASANNAVYTYKLDKGIGISGVINFSGPVDGLDKVEEVFINNKIPIMREIGNALFVGDGYANKDTVAKYNPITYFDKNDPPFFLWHGEKDDQVPASTFVKFVELLNEDKKKNKVIFLSEGFHSPNANELKDAYDQIFIFLDNL